MKNDIRWLQRFSNYQKALSQLQKFIDKPELNELEAQGLIQAFEYTYELAWNVIKDYFEHQGETGIQGSRDAFRLAFKRGLIEDGSIWLTMVESRIQTTHTYNEEITLQISREIRENYHNLFLFLKEKLQAVQQDNPD